MQKSCRYLPQELNAIRINDLAGITKPLWDEIPS